MKYLGSNVRFDQTHEEKKLINFVNFELSIFDKKWQYYLGQHFAHRPIPLHQTLRLLSEILI